MILRQFRIQVTGRFIGNNQRGLLTDRSGDADPLLLTRIRPKGCFFSLPDKPTLSSAARTLGQLQHAEPAITSARATLSKTVRPEATIILKNKTYFLRK